MSGELNRRSLVGITLGSAAVFGAARTAFAQDASPSALPEMKDEVISLAEGPGEGEVTIVHAQGETMVKRNPSTVVSFDVAAIETIELLGGTITGAPEIASGRKLSESATENVGSMFEPDYETVNALSPDLIICAGRSAGVYPELSKIAPTIDVSFGTDMMASLEQVSTVLASIIGKEAEAADRLAEINNRVAAIREAASTAGTGLVIMVSAGSVTALAPNNARGGRGALVYNVLGIQPPVDDLETATHGEPISFEFLLEHNPDWLFVIDRDQAVGEEGQPASQVLDNEIMHQTTAWQQNQIVYVDPFDWYIITGASLPSMGRMLGEMETAFGV